MKTIVLLVLVLGALPVAAAEAERLLLLQRHREYLAETFFPQGKYYRAGGDVERAAEWAAALNAAGQWPDLNYADQADANWHPLQHLRRTRALCLALADARGSLYRDAHTRAAAERALRHWLARRYQSGNWWFNQIGVPLQLRDILVLQQGELDGELWAAALALARKQCPPAPAGEAQNSVWVADIALFLAALAGDEAAMPRNARVIAGEIRSGGREGIQPDFSFYQHHNCFQQFSYGQSYLSDLARLAWELDGTPWALAEEKKKLLADYLLEGSRWMQRRGHTVPPTLDRSASRPGAMRVDLRPSAARLAAALPGRDFAPVLAGAVEPGCRWFPWADFLAYHRPAFSFFLKLTVRSLPAESINHENLRGGLMGAGDSYTLTAGDDYFALPPVWDWTLLPGVTWSPGLSQREEMAGNAVTDGASSAAAAEIKFPVRQGGDGAPLTVRKLWAAHGDAVLCVLLGGERESRTALEQCLLRGAVTVAETSAAARALGEGRHELRQARWLQHGALAYVPLTPSPLTVRLGAATGNWRSINAGYSAEPVTEPVLLAVAEHEAGAGFAYMIAAAATPAEAEALAAPRVLSNTAACQAARFADGTLMAAFYSAGELADGGRRLLEVSAPCVLLQSGGKIWLGRLRAGGGEVSVSVGGGAARNVQLPKNGTAVALP